MNEIYKTLSNDPDFQASIQQIRLVQQKVIEVYSPVLQFIEKFNAALNTLMLPHLEDMHKLISASFAVLQTPQAQAWVNVIHELSLLSEDELLDLYKDYLEHKSELPTNTHTPDINVEDFTLPTFLKELSPEDRFNFLQFIVMLVVSISIAYVNHLDANRAHEDAIQAHQDAVNALKQNNPDNNTNKSNSE